MVAVMRGFVTLVFTAEAMLWLILTARALFLLFLVSSCCMSRRGHVQIRTWDKKKSSLGRMLIFKL